MTSTTSLQVLSEHTPAAGGVSLSSLELGAGTYPQDPSQRYRLALNAEARLSPQNAQNNLSPHSSDLGADLVMPEFEESDSQTMPAGDTITGSFVSMVESTVTSTEHVGGIRCVVL